MITADQAFEQLLAEGYDRGAVAHAIGVLIEEGLRMRPDVDWVLGPADLERARLLAGTPVKHEGTRPSR